MPDVNPAIDLSQVGLDVSADFCCQQLERIVPAEGSIWGKIERALTLEDPDWIPLMGLPPSAIAGCADSGTAMPSCTRRPSAGPRRQAHGHAARRPGLEAGQKIAYVFDFSDEWRVRLSVTRIEPADGGVYPRILESRGVAPPQYPPYEDELDKVAWATLEPRRGQAPVPTGLPAPAH